MYQSKEPNNHQALVILDANRGPLDIAIIHVLNILAVGLMILEKIYTFFSQYKSMWEPAMEGGRFRL